jgi:hypothetical protein
MVLGSIIMFALIYILLFALWVFLLDKAIRQGPDMALAGSEPSPDEGAISAITARAAHRRPNGAADEGEE